MIPSTQPELRIAALFNRKPTTHWSEKEMRVFNQLVKDKCLTDFDNFDVIERYYVYQRRKGDKGIHRRDLYTFLNNFAGELDRARAWDVDKRRQMATRNVPVTQRNGKPVSDEEFKRIGELAKAELARFKQNFR